MLWLDGQTAAHALTNNDFTLQKGLFLLVIMPVIGGLNSFQAQYAIGASSGVNIFGKDLMEVSLP